MASARDISVHVGGGLESAIDAGWLEAALEHVLRAEHVAAAEISVALVGDERIAALNREYLHHDGATDVISFPLEQPAGRDAVLGDIYIGAEQARRQAAEHGVPLREELLRLAVHGTLHVLGYDHPDGDDREGSPMYVRQEQLVAEALRIPLPG